MAARDDVAGPPLPPLPYRLTDGVAAVVAMGLVLFSVGPSHGLRYHAPTTTMAALTVAGTMPVAVRRIWPIPVLTVVTAACCVLTRFGYPDFLTADADELISGRRLVARARLTDARGSPGCSDLAWSVERAP
jgi:hypothetical protein